MCRDFEKNISVQDPSTCRIRNVYKVYPSKSDLVYQMSTIGQPKKAEKVFIYSLKVPIYSIKINGGKAAKILKANNISQYFTIF